MEIVNINVSDLRPAEYNPRRKSEHVLNSIRSSLAEHGFLQPLVVNQHQCEKCGDRRNVIVGGHRRLDAARAEGHELAPAVLVDLHIADEKKVNLRLNAQEEFKQHELANLIAEIHTLDQHAAETLGFNAQTIVEMLYDARYGSTPLKTLLADKFLIPPFSVFDSKQGYWQRRKTLWRELLGNIAETREDKLAGSKNNLLMRGVNAGVSQFDPVLSEVIYQWFIPERGGSILDPFAGALSRGGVAAAHGYDYHGIEIRKEQIDVNLARCKEIGFEHNPTFYHADANDLDAVIAPEAKFDLIFTCSKCSRPRHTAPSGIW